MAVAEEEEVPRGKTEIDLVIPIVFYNAFLEILSLFSGCSGCKFRQGIAMAAGGVKERRVDERDGYVLSFYFMRNFTTNLFLLNISSFYRSCQSQ